MNVLIAEDDPVSRRLLEALLTKWGDEIVVATDGTKAWRLLQRDNAPRLVILDWSMPGMDGLQLCREIRKRTGTRYVYILLLTTKDQEQDIVEGFEAGADEYLIKPFDARELKARLRAVRRILELQEQLTSTIETLRVEATQDPLTGLWNRGAILEIVQRELARTQRQGIPVGVALADVDHFKSINDTYGHLAGDAILREVTRRMLSSMRPYDEIGRYGGEEFLIVAPGCDLTGARHQAERLRERITRDALDIFEGAIAITASLGVAASTSAKEADSLIRAAEAALNRAQNAGGNRVETATAEEIDSLPSSTEPDHSRTRTH